MDRIKETLNLIKIGVREEVSGLNKLSGDKLAEFVDIFNLDEDIELYFNKYNLIILDPDLHDQLSPYLKRGDLVLSIEIPEHNIFFWSYQYFNNHIFETYVCS